MRDFLGFRTMITPVFIQILFWVGVFACLAAAGLILSGLFNGMFLKEEQRILVGVGIILLGPLVIRIYCEILILPFRINESLGDIRDNTRRRL